MYRRLLLALARHEVFHRLLLACPMTKRVVRLFVAGATWDAAHPTVAALLRKGLKVTAEFLAPDARTIAQAEANQATYIGVLDRIGAAGWAADVEVSVRLSALGLALNGGEDLARDHAMALAERARAIGTNLTIDAPAAAYLAKTWRIATSVRRRFPETGYVVQANSKRAESDCRALDGPGVKVRLCKGSYRSPAQVAYTNGHDVDLSYVRCLKTLMEGEGLPLVATHDPIMIEIAQELAAHSNRGLKDFEFQMLYGMRTIEQERLTDLGHTVRVGVPFGEDWYDYLVHRLAQNPSRLLLFLHTIVRNG